MCWVVGSKTQKNSAKWLFNVRPACEWELTAIKKNQTMEGVSCWNQSAPAASFLWLPGRSGPGSLHLGVATFRTFALAQTLPRQSQSGGHEPTASVRKASGAPWHRIPKGSSVHVSARQPRKAKLKQWESERRRHTPGRAFSNREIRIKVYNVSTLLLSDRLHLRENLIWLVTFCPCCELRTFGLQKIPENDCVVCARGWLLFRFNSSLIFCGNKHVSVAHVEIFCSVQSFVFQHAAGSYCCNVFNALIVLLTGGFPIGTAHLLSVSSSLAVPSKSSSTIFLNA